MSTWTLGKLFFIVKKIFLYWFDLLENHNSAQDNDKKMHVGVHVRKMGGGCEK